MAELDIPARSSDGVPIKKVVLAINSMCIGGSYDYPTHTARPGQVRLHETFACMNGHDGVATVSYAPLEAVLRGPAPADGSPTVRVPFTRATGTCSRKAPVKDVKGVTFSVQGSAEVHYDRTKPRIAERALRDSVTRLAGRPVRVPLTSGRGLSGVLEPRGTDGIALRVAGDERVNFVPDAEIADIEPAGP